MSRLQFVLFFLSLLVYIRGIVSSPCTYYVDPVSGDDSNNGMSQSQSFRSVHKVSDMLPKTNKSTPSKRLTVCLAGGVHTLEGKPLDVSSSSGVTWQPIDQSSADIVSFTGGVEAAHWYPCDEEGPCPGWKDVWVHDIKDIPGLPANMVPVRELWVDGSRATRTFIEGVSLGLHATSTGYTSSVNMSNWAQGPVELRWPSQIKNWIEPRCLATLSSPTSLTVDSACWKALIARNENKLPPSPAYIENINVIPHAGEFFSTSNYIFYRPLGDFPHSTQPTNAYVPAQEVLLIGDSTYDHVWNGISFMYSTWRVVEDAGYVPTQTLVTPHGEPPAAVQITHSSNISFTNCHFQHIGSAYALSIGKASQGVTVSGCNFTDLSGGAVKVANVNNSRAVTKDPAQMDTNYLLEHSLIQDAAVEWRGAAQVFAGYVADIIIRQNTIRRTGYTGISLGWGWGSVISFARNNHVTGNRLENVMSALNDGGCIYTLGPQPNSTVSHNYCVNDHAPVVGFFYHDNGSRYFNTSFNVADSGPAPCVYLQGWGTPAFNISVSDLWCHDTAPVRNGCAPQGCYINNATVYNVTTLQWPKEAQAIIDASGCGL